VGRIGKENFHEAPGTSMKEFLLWGEKIIGEGGGSGYWGDGGGNYVIDLLLDQPRKTGEGGLQSVRNSMFIKRYWKGLGGWWSLEEGKGGIQEVRLPKGWELSEKWVVCVHKRGKWMWILCANSKNTKKATNTF